LTILEGNINLFDYLKQDSDSTHSGGIAQRARHPDELKRDPNKWMIDIDYYLSQQVLLYI
jgi:DNA polymerase elongation subunit (family B)